MNHIAEAVEPRRAASIERARNLANENICRAYLDLAVNDWDLDKAAPGPNGRMSRVAYKMAQAKRDFYTSITVAHPDAPRRIRNTDPRPVIASDERISIVLNRVEREAGEQFDAYIGKLTVKVGETIAASINDSPLWNGSVLTVTKPDGTTEQWKTKMIINVSSLGKLFNQWPTRRI